MAHALETLLLPPALRAVVGGLVGVIPGLLVRASLNSLGAVRSDSGSDLVACPDKLTWGVRYNVTCLTITMES
jgi:hypothetical protein